MKKTLSTVQEIHKKYNFEYFPLSDFLNVKNFTNGDNIFVISIECETIIEGFNERRFINNWEAFCTQEDLKDILDHPDKIDFEEVNNSKYTNKTNLFLAKKDYIDFFTKYGEEGSTLSDYYNKKSPPMLDCDFLSALKSDDYRVLEYCKETNIPYYFKDEDNNLFFAPIHLDYIMANINEKEFDLPALLSFLKEKDNLVFSDNQRRHNLYQSPLDENKKLEDFILEVPYYNRNDDDDEKYYLDFFVLPNQDEAKQILEWKEVHNNFSDIHSYQQYIIHHVLDGLAFKNNKNPSKKFKY